MSRRLSDYAVFTAAAMRAIGPRSLAEGRRAMRHVAAVWRSRRSNPGEQVLSRLENPAGERYWLTLTTRHRRGPATQELAYYQREGDGDRWRLYFGKAGRRRAVGTTGGGTVRWQVDLARAEGRFVRHEANTPDRNPKKRKRPTGGDWQPDLFGGAGIQRGGGDGLTKAEQLALARQEMRDTGSRDLFDLDLEPEPRRRNSSPWMTRANPPSGREGELAGRRANGRPVMQIAFTADKRGRPVAYRLDRSNGFRWFRMGLDDAKLRIATGTAREVRYHGRNPAGEQMPPPISPPDGAELRYQRAVGHGERPSTARTAARNPGRAIGRTAPNCPACGDLVRLPNPVPPVVECASCGQQSQVRRP